MDIFKGKRSFAQGGTKYINKPIIGQERTQGIAPFLFVWSSVREKETTTQPTPKAKPQSQESKTKSRKTGKAGQEDKRRKRKDKRTKGQKDKKTKRGQTRHKPLIRLTLHAHKSHTSQAKHQNNTNPHNNPKTPLKREIEPYLQATQRGAKQESGQKAGNTTRGPEPTFRQVLNPKSLHQVDTMKARQPTRF